MGAPGMARIGVGLLGYSFATQGGAIYRAGVGDIFGYSGGSAVGTKCPVTRRFGTAFTYIVPADAGDQFVATGRHGFSSGWN